MSTTTGGTWAGDPNYLAAKKKNAYQQSQYNALTKLINQWDGTNPQPQWGNESTTFQIPFTPTSDDVIIKKVENGFIVEFQGIIHVFHTAEEIAEHINKIYSEKEEEDNDE